MNFMLISIDLLMNSFLLEIVIYFQDFKNSFTFFRYKGGEFAKKLTQSVENKKKKRKSPKQNRYHHYCWWAHALLVSTNQNDTVGYLIHHSSSFKPRAITDCQSCSKKIDSLTSERQNLTLT